MDAKICAAISALVKLFDASKLRADAHERRIRELEETNLSLARRLSSLEAERDRIVPRYPGPDDAMQVYDLPEALDPV